MVSKITKTTALLSAVILVLLAGCSQNSSKEDGEEPVSGVTAAPTVTAIAEDSEAKIPKSTVAPTATSTVEATETTIPKATARSQEALSLAELDEWDLVYLSDNSSVGA